jgi:hypothetical protein
VSLDTSNSSRNIPRIGYGATVNRKRGLEFEKARFYCRLDLHLNWKQVEEQGGGITIDGSGLIVGSVFFFLELFHWCWGMETKIRMMMVFFFICNLLALDGSEWAIPGGTAR